MCSVYGQHVHLGKCVMFMDNMFIWGSVFSLIGVSGSAAMFQPTPRVYAMFLAP